MKSLISECKYKIGGHHIGPIAVLLLILHIPISLHGEQSPVQEVVFEDPDEYKLYKSKEEDSYYTHNYREFTIQPIEIAKNHGLRHLKILPTADNAKHEINDSNIEKLNRDIEFLDPQNLTNEPKRRGSLMSYSNSTGTIMTLFLDSKYDEFMWGEPGYWINLTDNKGSHDYYTGLAQNYYIRLVDSGDNVWKNDSTLLINGVRVRLLKPFIHPISAPKYEMIDNVKIEISIPDLIKDSDKDGLTDIEEDKMMLSPFSRDTDGDGTMDLEDHNPRFKSEITSETLLYKALLEYSSLDTIKIRDNKILNSKKPRQVHPLKAWTRLVVTDDISAQKVDFDYNRTIIISKSDYANLKIRYPIPFDETYISPLFKVDDMTDTFVISVSSDLGGSKYLIKKLVNGFDIKQIETWIH